MVDNHLDNERKPAGSSPWATLTNSKEYVFYAISQTG